MEPISGMDLKLLRIRARVMAKDVARAAGWNRTRVHQVEASWKPTDRTVERYMAALRAARTGEDR